MNESEISDTRHETERLTLLTPPYLTVLTQRSLRFDLIVVVIIRTW